MPCIEYCHQISGDSIDMPKGTFSAHILEQKMIEKVLYQSSIPLTDVILR